MTKISDANSLMTKCFVDSYAIQKKTFQLVKMLCNKLSPSHFNPDTPNISDSSSKLNSTLLTSCSENAGNTSCSQEVSDKQNDKILLSQLNKSSSS